MRILLTGGAGFIGSAVIRHIVGNTSHSVLNVDKLTYAGDLSTVSSVSKSSRYLFKRIDICDRAALGEAVREYKPEAIMHLAAESHVDRSIDGPAEFINTNIIGTVNLLNISKDLWENNKEHKFYHISTDEVYGSLEEGYFSGTVTVTGNLSKGGGSFKIDHPLEPENKFLYHSFVESPDMMNVYNGNIVLDANGEAIVEFEAWFEPLNRDFRYQLTAIGAPGPVTRPAATSSQVPP